MKRLTVKTFPPTLSPIFLVSTFAPLTNNHCLVLMYLLLEFLHVYISKYR